MIIFLHSHFLCKRRANGSRYPLVGGTRLAVETEKTESCEKAQKRGAYPAVHCTPCWAHYFIARRLPLARASLGLCALFQLCPVLIIMLIIYEKEPDNAVKCPITIFVGRQAVVLLIRDLR